MPKPGEVPRRSPDNIERRERLSASTLMQQPFMVPYTTTL